MNESGLGKLSDQVSFLKDFLQEQTKCPKSELVDLDKKIRYFVKDFKRRWSDAHRTRERFLAKNTSWLETSITFINYDISKKSNIGVGRPKTNFIETTERTKRHRTKHLRSEFSHEELSYATQMSLRSAGQTDASKLIKEITSTSPKRATRYRTAFEESEVNKSSQLSPEEALSMFVDAKLTRNQYNIIRAKDKARFPSYKILQNAKQNCYPKPEHILVNDVFAEVKLQGLLDHTASRLLQVQRDVIVSQVNITSLHLIYKWGFDGSSGHSEYKQKFSSSSASDASIFLSSLVPLRLINGEPDGTVESQIVLWNNMQASSTRYCRPIRFRFIHETIDVAKQEKDDIESQIQKLAPLKVEINGRKIKVYHKLLFTMVDGKICNSLTDTTSTLKCYLCGLTSKHFNDIEKCLTTNVPDSMLTFGLSVLHTWIRFFECLIHLAYKLPLKKWQARGTEDKKLVETRKRTIQSQLKSQLGLIVDKPKPGYGSSNDGNTARRFFENAEMVSAITEVDINIIKRFRTILKAVASGYNINIDKFKTYTLETAQLFVKTYPWYPMPPTVHKVLIHGSIIIKKALLPIGQLSEEAQEARNKDFKKYREGFSRKISREKTNMDVLRRLLLSSDPLLSSLHQPVRRKRNLDSEVVQLLVAPAVAITISSEEESSSESVEVSDSD